MAKCHQICYRLKVYHPLPPPPAFFGPPPPIEIKISIDGFIVVGFKEAFLLFTPPEMADGMMPEDMVDGMIPEEIEAPVEPAEPAENEAPAEEE